MHSAVADLFSRPAIADHIPAPPELVRLRAAIVAERFRNGTASCGERASGEAWKCERRRRIKRDGVPGGCFSCSRAGV